jgi:hypothetical protein
MLKIFFPIYFGDATGRLSKTSRIFANALALCRVKDDDFVT